MAPDVGLDLALIRTAKRKEVAEYIIRLLEAHSPKLVCKAFLAAVEEEALKPDVFSVFLPASKSIDCIIMCLDQKHSVYVRRTGIKQFGRSLEHPDDWRKAWGAVNGSLGLLKYFTSISVNDVKFFLQKIGNCNKGNIRSEEREKAIEGLLRAMMPSTYPEMQVKSTEKRPLQGYVAQLIPACSSQLVKQLLEKGPESDNPLYANAPRKRLIRTHGTVLQQNAYYSAFKDAAQKARSQDHDFLREFVKREPPKQGNEPRFSASMSFSLRLLEQRVANPNVAWIARITEIDIYFSLLRRCVRKRITKRRLHEIVELGLRLFETIPDWKHQFSGFDFWAILRTYWKYNPALWEDLFVRGLRLGLGGGHKRIGETLKHANGLDTVRTISTWHLIRLYCQYVPKQGIGIESADDFAVLAKQEWWVDTFTRLEPEKAINFLKRLITANPEYEFLRTQSIDTILKKSSITGQRNFNAWLLLTQIQVKSPDLREQQEAKQRAAAAVADLRQKSGLSREQPDRAEFAKAACYFAIASGSLELYGETISWLKRFIRDPLTVKVVFNKEAMASREGSDLLSGIPDPIPKDLNLATLSANVSKANEILLTFHAHRRLAQLEPSFQKYDWTAVSVLLKSAITTRIARASKVQEVLNVDDGELYSAMWSQTFAMFSQVGAESLKEVEHEVTKLMSQLPPKTLATATTSMLATDDNYRAETSKSGESWDEFRVVERLTYHCLRELAKGDKPALAKDLVIKTIIDRPDASSWHRQLLNMSYLKRLPAEEAEDMLLTFATAIGEKLEEQAYVRIGEAVYASSLVKVTTVKYLAQLLQNAEFISAEAVVDVLVELFKAGTHPDIRQATLESMLSSLDSLCNSTTITHDRGLRDIGNPLISKILKALETVIPVVGSINERRPPRELDWEEAVLDKTKIPDVYFNPARGSGPPPLWSTLILATTGNQWPSLKKLKTLFVDRLILPITEHSVAQHGRWLRLFLEKYDAEFKIDDLPSIPIAPVQLSRMVSNLTELIPYSELDRMTKYTNFLSKLPAKVRKFNEKLKKDTELAKKPDVKHWLSVFDPPSNDSSRQKRLMLIDCIHHSWTPCKLPEECGITVQRIQAAILAEADILLNNYDENVGQWDIFVNKLRHSRGSRNGHKLWYENCRPILEQIVKMVDAKRTPQWIKDPNRKPSILPSTVKLRLWLLKYPIREAANESEEDSACLVLSKELLALVGQLLGTEKIRLDKLVVDILTVSEKLNDRERLRTGCILGDTTELTISKSERELVLRIDVAIRFIEVGKSEIMKNKGLKEKLQQLVGNWQKSPVEDVRERVFEWKMNQRSLWHDIFVEEKE